MVKENKALFQEESLNSENRENLLKKSFKKLEENKNIQIKFCVISIAVLVVLYVPLFFMVSKHTHENQIITKSISFEESILANVEEVSLDKGRVNISGWAIKDNAEIVDATVVLEAENVSPILLSTKLENGGSVESQIKYFEMGDATEGVNFTASVDSTKLRQDISYTVLLNIKYRIEEEENEQKISTLSFVFNNEKYNYKPEKYTAPVFQDEHMREVVEKSQILLQSMENGTWVYLYNGSMYWVFDTAYEWNRKEDVYIFLHMSTFAKNKLPQERMQYGFDNKDFFLRDKELFLENENRYRVARVEIETDYPIAYLSTGHYDIQSGSNRWLARFLMTPQ